ncbi:FRG domain-containing protein [Vibrio tarriae]|uniref:FRG domain-containing protein n=1 Tax=Vibrio tarriae TaxID=2014742 RepID=UPI0011BF076E|nr:FRG domain-containing protein [Vibrio tarriae]
MIISDFWKPFEYEITSFDELVDVIQKVMRFSTKKDRTFAWRGQVDANWSLHSSLYRRACLSKGKVLSEKEIAEVEARVITDLHRWGLHSSAETGRLSILNQLAMLQHYGAPTRLIDITFNAWVAVWFAVEEKWSNGIKLPDDKDARLFAIDVSGRLINEINDLRQWEDSLTRPWKAENDFCQKTWTTSVYAWKPSNINGRIAAQNGGFLFGGVPATKRPDKKSGMQIPKTGDTKNAGCWLINEVREAICVAARPHKFEVKAGREVESDALFTFRIKAKAIHEIRECLDKMFGYRHSTIYPDYTGFAQFGTRYLKH